MGYWTRQKNVISFNNVKFCGQVVTDTINFQNVSGSGCEFNPSVPEVPVPAAVWLFGTALAGLLGFSKRRKSKLAA
ncbi:MAG: PEP-CTERM sorting domain-containing protein [Gammaproteobacteria bacterium]|nr:PEP-CTERM sorting domain-containing protein [Gammaproteobacteria bacterium]